MLKTLPSSDHAPFDCIVVGAGFAGLSAARRLEDADLRVQVLEARDRVGGRSEGGEIAGLKIDLGGMWVGPTQDALIALGQHYGVETYPTHLHGKSLGRLGRKAFEADGEAFEDQIGLISKLSLGMLSARLDKLLRRVDAEAPWSAPGAADLDRQTVASWADRSIHDGTVRKMLDFVVRSVFCCEADDLSLLFFLFYVKAAGGLEVLVKAGPGGAQNHLYVDGLHQIAMRMAEDLARPVRLAAPVVAIAQSEEGVCVTTADGATVRARFAIVATPPALVQDIAFDPALPQQRTQLLRRQVMGACIKVWIAYDCPFWRESGRNGAIIDEAAAFAPVFDVTPPGTDKGLLAGFFDAQAGAIWADRSEVERRDEVIRVLVAAFGPDAAEPLDVKERDWTREAYSRGCYGAYMPPGALTKYGHTLRAPTGRVHWAGTETATAWSGYVDGAITSGYRAADAVAACVASELTRG